MDIQRFVENQGLVSFRDFMEHALYCHEDGFYGAGKVHIGGKKMDFTTHPELTSPFFGRALVRQISQMWKLMNQPAKFDLVELGGGNGVMARDILSEAKRFYPDLFRAIKMTIVEISPALVQRQKRALAHFGNKVLIWQGSALDFRGELRGVIISNELLDSLPVHRVVIQDGKPYEVMVGYDGGKFVEELRELSRRELLQYLASLGMKLFSGQHLCVNLDALKLMTFIARNLRQGYIITIDYGDTAEVLFGDDLSYLRVGRDRQVGSYPYLSAGDADITSDVDFTSLVKHGRSLGLRDFIYLSEADYFKHWLKEEIDFIEGAEKTFEHFIGSRHKVLVQAKEAPEFDLPACRQAGKNRR